MGGGTTHDNRQVATAKTARDYNSEGFVFPANSLMESNLRRITTQSVLDSPGQSII